MNEEEEAGQEPSQRKPNRVQTYLRISLAALAVTCLVNFVLTRGQIDLIAALLSSILVLTTGQMRRGAFFGAAAAGATLLVIRAHQILVGLAPDSMVFHLNLLLPVPVLAFAIMAVLATRS